MSPARLPRREFLRLGACGTLAASLLSLPRAHARDGSATPALRLLYFTDVHATNEGDVPDALDRAAEALRTIEADLVICGGDAVHGGFNGTAEVMTPRWGTYRSFLSRLGRPVHHVLGNHDFVEAMAPDGSVTPGDPSRLWRAHLGIDGPAYRSFDHAGWHVILLDSVQPVGGATRYRGWIGEAQLAWLRGDLAAVRPGTPILLATHIPLRTTFSQVIEGSTAALPPNLVVGNAREVLALFEGHDLRLVLQGHLHVDELVRFNGTSFYMGGAICGGWWRGPANGTPEGFATIDLGARGAPAPSYRTWPRRPPA
jgi:3',5'-cyclic AMP phosphodiesterase CpdA